MHLGVVPDGNRRWAKLRQSSLREAYAIGFCNVIALSLAAPAFGIRELTIFGLSEDNLSKRSQRQVEVLFAQISDSLLVASALLADSGISVAFYGAIEELKPAHRASLAEIESVAAKVSSVVVSLNILVNYSDKWDLRTRPGSLGTDAIPACDLLFRSGGRRRLSGFLPAQTAHAELCFSDSLWPDVDPSEISHAVEASRRVPRTKGR